MKTTCILSSDMPDPTILRVGDYFYLTCSTLNYSPGLIIRRSADLVKWETVCSVFDDCLGDVWAPELAQHNGKFYIYFPTNKNGRIQVFATCSDRIDGGWCTPAPVGADYLIDPGFISDGKNSWLYFNDGYCARLTEDCMRLAENPHKVWRPWQFPTDWKTEGICAESPKLFRKNGFYYLIAAEGGTAGPPTSHMAVCFRAVTPLGPIPQTKSGGLRGMLHILKMPTEKGILFITVIKIPIVIWAGRYLFAGLSGQGTASL